MDFWLPWMYLHPFCTKFPWSFSSNVEGISNHWMFTLVFSIVKQFKKKMLTFLVKYHNPKQQWIALSLKKRWIETFLITFFHIKRPSSCVCLYRPNSHKTQKSFTLPIRPTYMGKSPSNMHYHTHHHGLPWCFMKIIIFWTKKKFGLGMQIWFPSTTLWTLGNPH
jgi:hypothetical protein